jgi:hypothetical protein
MGLATSTVNELLTDIESGQTALPDMQRDFVWENTKVRDLVSALYRNHPIGMLLLWETNPDDNIPMTRIDDLSKETTKYAHLVIDGQQRLTSLYLVKHGKIFQHGSTAPRTIELFFNPLEERFEVAMPGVRDAPGWFNLTSLIQEGEAAIADHIKLEKLSWSADEIARATSYEMMKRLGEVRNIFVGSRNSVPVFSISSTVDYEEVTQIFLDVNSAGTRIRVTELLLALLALKVPGAFKQSIRRFVDQLQEQYHWEVDISVLVRCLVAIAANEGKLKSFRTIAKSIDADSLSKYWHQTEEAFSACVRMLDENLGIHTTDILPSQQVLIPLTYYLATKKGGFTAEESNDFSLWFLLASFWQRYSGSTETQLDADIRTVHASSSLKGLFASLRKDVGRLLIDEDRFAGRSRNSRLLSYVTARANGAEDWFKGHKITSTDYEEHHIIPRSLLKGKYDLALIDDTSNLAFLTEKANKLISNTDPAMYLQDIDPTKLQLQCVPMDRALWQLDRYPDFLQERRRLLVETINNYLRTLGIDAYVPPQSNPQ